jgi:hypothetical protein
VKRLLNFFVDLCLLRVPPQRLPASKVLFWLMLPLNLVVGIIMIGDRFGGLDRAFVAALLDLLLIMLWLWGLLAFKHHVGRFLQSATAVMGTGVLLGLFVLPLQVAVGDGTTGGAVAEVAGVFLFLAVIWSQVVTAHILRHALDIGMGLALGLSMTYTIVITLLLGILFPEITL